VAIRHEPSESAGEAPKARAAGDVYRVGGWAETTVRENVERVGEGVVLIKVPGSLGSGFVIDERGWVAPVGRLLVLHFLTHRL
jgi:hypothetical protein